MPREARDHVRAVQDKIEREPQSIQAVAQSKIRAHVTATSSMSVVNVALLKSVIDRASDRYYTLNLTTISACLLLQAAAGLLSLIIEQTTNYYLKFASMRLPENPKLLQPDTRAVTLLAKEANKKILDKCHSENITASDIEELDFTIAQAQKNYYYDHMLSEADNLSFGVAESIRRRKIMQRAAWWQGMLNYVFYFIYILNTFISGFAVTSSPQQNVAGKHFH